MAVKDLTKEQFYSILHDCENAMKRAGLDDDATALLELDAWELVNLSELESTRYNCLMCLIRLIRLI